MYAFHTSDLGTAPILVFDPLIYLYTFVLGTLSLLSSFFDRDGSIQHGFARLWSILILKTSFVRVQARAPFAHEAPQAGLGACTPARGHGRSGAAGAAAAGRQRE